jgi:hypothetical protein
MSRRGLFRSGAALAAAGVSASIPEPVLAAPAHALELGGNLYESIGVTPIVNCQGTYTIITGSQTLPEVKRAMEQASHAYVHMDELMEAVGQRLAELTKAEWGIVTAGCAAALTHATSACISGGDPEKMQRVPNLTGLKNEVVVPRYSRFHPDLAVREVLLFPDGHHTLQTVDPLQRGLERRPAMRRRHHDRDAGFPDQDASEPVHYGDPADGKTRRNFAADANHQLDGHRLVTIVIQVVRQAAVRIVADHAFEGDHRAILSPQQLVGDLARDDGVPREGEEVAVLGNLARGAGAAADGGRKAISSPSASGVNGPANSWLRASRMLPAISRMRGNRLL